MKLSRLIACALPALLWLDGIGARAQDYLSRPVTIVVPSTPGGCFDLVGRVMAEALSKQSGKSFGGLENRLVVAELVKAPPPLVPSRDRC